MKAIIARTRGSARLLATASVVCVAAAVQPAFAQSQNSTLETSATVTANCVIETTPLAFNDVDVTSGDIAEGTGGVEVLCTNGSPWEISANAGLGAGAMITDRKMTSNGNLLDYGIYTDAGYLTVLGDGIDGSVIDGAGEGTAQSFTLYGKIPAGQTELPEGAYTDTVAVTVTY